MHREAKKSCVSARKSTIRRKSSGDVARTDFGWDVGGAGQVVTDVEADSIIIGAPQFFRETDPYGATFVFYGPLEPTPLQRTFQPLILRNW